MLKLLASDPITKDKLIPVDKFKLLLKETLGNKLDQVLEILIKELTV